MLSRRCRIQARPNVASGSKKSKPVPVFSTKVLAEVSSPPSPSPPSPLPEALQPERVSDTEAPSLTSAVQFHELQPVPLVLKAVPNELAEASTSSVIDTTSLVADVTCRPVSFAKSLRFTSPCKSQSNSLKSPKPQSLLKSPVIFTGANSFPDSEQSFREHTRTVSSASCYQLSQIKSDYSPKVKYVRKKFTGEEPLDPKTMTMQDLIFWNPKNEKRLHEDRQKKRHSDAVGEDVQEKDTESGPKKLTKTAFAAPQVKIAEDGSLVIDESSLTITNENDSSVWETVEEDRTNKKLNSMSFRKRPLCRGNPWSDLETDLFYDILRATGPDFGLMHEFFPSRTRLELKAKYNREERLNWARLNQALAVPTMLTDALYSHANEIIDRIKEEEIKKKLKLTKKIGVSGDNAAVDWNEEEADLEAEAEEAILNILEEEGEEQATSSERKLRKEKTAAKKKMKEALLSEAAEEAAQMLKAKKSEKRKSELKEICEKALTKLDKDFPKFEILIDENADNVSLEASTGSEGPPVIRIPLGTVAKVLPADAKQPQRVFFECFGKKNTAARQYVVQHQLGPGQPSTGFLHLFGTLDT